MISSIHNKRVAKAARLKKRAMREKDRRFLVEGAKPVIEALAQPGLVSDLFYSAADREEAPPGERLEEVLAAAKSAGIEARSVDAEVMAHLTSTVTPSGPWYLTSKYWPPIGRER